MAVGADECEIRLEGVASTYFNLDVGFAIME